MAGILASERTPLLNSPTLQVDDGPRQEVLRDNQKVSLFWEELRILTGYSLPVFGFVINIALHVLAVLNHIFFLERIF